MKCRHSLLCITPQIDGNMSECPGEMLTFKHKGLMVRILFHQTSVELMAWVHAVVRVSPV